jgi:fructose-specific phosphotransferase system component IIB
MSAPGSRGVFISYRRQESSGLAGRLYERLAARLGDDQVFMDVDTIDPGVDFTEVITQAVSTCQVLLAVIGPHWASATDQDGQRRLEDPDDIVRLEIAAALERDIRVIPILVEGAEMPRPQQLPDDLVRLARRNAVNLRHEGFRADADRLLAVIEPILHAATDLAASVPAQATPSGETDHMGRRKLPTQRPFRIVAVAVSPIPAKTDMAVEALEQAAKNAGHDIKVETQGAAADQPVADADIAAADAVVFASAFQVLNRERFAGKPLVQSSIRWAINAAPNLIAKAEQAFLSQGS